MSEAQAAAHTPGTNIVAAPQPTRAQYKRLSEVRTIGEALRHPDVVERFKQAAPRHLSPERMLRVCALAVQKTPKLAECDMMSLLGAMLALGSLGLEPNTPLGLAYLIPFEKRAKVNGKWQTTGVEVQVIIGYRGYIELARRTGSMVSIHADVVYEGDEFTFEYGSQAHLRHVPKGSRAGRKPLWAYAHAKLVDGEAFEVLPYAEVLRIRDGSQGYVSALRVKENNPRAFETNPWVAFEHEMSSKTMVRRISKMLPMSIEMMNAAALDAMSEVGKVDLRTLAMDPTTGLADVALLGSDETIAPIDIGAGNAEPVGSQQQERPQQAQQQQRQTPRQATPAHQQRASTAPGQQQQPPKPQASQRPAFEAWAADENGEPVAGENGAMVIHYDPVSFANWYVNRWMSSDNREALRENNTDAIDEAMAQSSEAAEILANTVEPPQEEGGNQDEQQQQSEPAAPGGSDNGFDLDDPMHPYRVGVPHNTKNQPFLPGYVANVRESLAGIDASRIREWVEVNRRIYEPMPAATRRAIELAVNDRLAALGLGTQPALGLGAA